MFNLPIPPDSQNYQVSEGNTNVSTQLDGGLPRVRADQLGAVKTVTCQWTLNPFNYNYMMAFYRVATANGSQPFSITLVGIDGSDQKLYTAWFVPGSFRPIAQQSGLTYIISAQLWVPPINNAATDAEILAAGPQA